METHKQYNNIPLSKLDPHVIAKEIGEIGLVVIRDSGASPEEFAEWNIEMGYHLSPHVWCTDKEHSDIFWRVTNQLVDGKHRGLKSDHDLDWHVNTNPVYDSEEVIGLYGKTITYPTETWLCNTIPYFRQLDKSIQDELKELNVVNDPKRKLGRMQEGGWQPDWQNYDEEIINDIYKNRKTREIANATNMEPENAHLYKPCRGIINSAKLVPNHPIGTEGLFFSPYEVHGFENKDGTPYTDSRRLYDKFWNDMFVSEQYIHKHVWQQGDIFLMDQLVTVHKRPIDSFRIDEPRELLRSAFWYKTADRQHTDYVV